MHNHFITINNKFNYNQLMSSGEKISQDVSCNCSLRIVDKKTRIESTCSESLKKIDNFILWLIENKYTTQDKVVYESAYNDHKNEISRCKQLISDFMRNSAITDEERNTRSSRPSSAATIEKNGHFFIGPDRERLINQQESRLGVKTVSSTIHVPNTLIIVTWNTGANHRNLDNAIISGELEDISNAASADVLLIQECPRSVQIKGYGRVAISAQFKLPNKKYTASCIFVKKAIIQTPVESGNSLSWNKCVMFAQWTLGGIEIVSAHIKSKIGLDKKQLAVGELLKLKKEMIIGGDFNMTPTELEGFILVKATNQFTHKEKDDDDGKVHDFFILSLPFMGGMEPEIVKACHGSDHQPVKLKIEASPAKVGQVL